MKQDWFDELSKNERAKLEDYFEHARREVLPKMKQSAVSITILHGDPDPKLCLELGAAILYEKPLIILAVKNPIIPDVLRRLADRIIEVDELNEETSKKTAAAVTEILDNHFPQRITEK